jgi:flagellar FliL protein
MAEALAATKEPPVKGGSRRMMLIGGGAVLLLGAGGGAAFWLGLVPMSSAPPEPVEVLPTFVDVPEIVANLNTAGRRQTFVRAKARFEVARPQDAALVQASMPRLLDMLATYLRETRPEELRSSVGLQRLRDEIIARANVATRPGVVTDILFVELVFQ